MRYMTGMSAIGNDFGSSRVPEPDSSQVQKAKETDRKVRSHEAAHQASAGNLATGGAQFQTEQGPDGKSYAVSGEVNIRLSAGKTPQVTIQRAQQAQRAALAPADPSPQDLQVAQEARAMEAQARTELAKSPTGGTGRSVPTPALGSRMDLKG
jgi:hypothetical protein